MKLPAKLPGAGVECANVAARLFLAPGGVCHRRADDDHVTDDERRARPAIVRHQGAEADFEIDTTTVPEVGIDLAGPGVQRVQIFASLHEKPFVTAPGPIGNAARAVAGEVGWRKRFLYPARLSRGRVKRLDQPHTVRGVEHPVDHERCGAEVRRNLERGILRFEARVDGRTTPEDLETRDVALVDLIERRILRAAAIAVIAPPLAVFGAVLRRHHG